MRKQARRRVQEDCRSRRDRSTALKQRGISVKRFELGFDHSNAFTSTDPTSCGAQRPDAKCDRQTQPCGRGSRLFCWIFASFDLVRDVCRGLPQAAMLFEVLWVHLPRLIGYALLALCLYAVAGLCTTFRRNCEAVKSVGGVCFDESYSETGRYLDMYQASGCSCILMQSLR